MPTLFMLGGLPGSGKSTYRQRVLDTNNSICPISSDDEIEYYAELHDIPYTEAFKLYAKIATNFMNAVLKQELDRNIDIIWDQTNLNIKTRKAKLSKIPDHYKKIMIFFDVDNKIIQQRNQDRKAFGRNIPDHVLDSMINSVELPTIDEGFDGVIINDDLQLTLLGYAMLTKQKGN